MVDVKPRCRLNIPETVPSLQGVDAPSEDWRVPQDCMADEGFADNSKQTLANNLEPATLRGHRTGRKAVPTTVNVSLHALSACLVTCKFSYGNSGVDSTSSQNQD